MEDYTVIYKLEKCYNIRAWNEDGMPIIGELDIWESTDSTYMCKLLGHKSLIFKGTHGTAFLFSFFLRERCLQYLKSLNIYIQIDLWTNISVLSKNKNNDADNVEIPSIHIQL